MTAEEQPISVVDGVEISEQCLECPRAKALSGDALRLLIQTAQALKLFFWDAMRLKTAAVQTDSASNINSKIYSRLTGVYSLC
jgi:hypothetical protein